jgi:hypothetical protein
MNKKRHDTIWNDLTPEQKATLRDWLLEKNLGYDDVLDHIRSQWGINASKASLCRYYQALQRERMRDNLNDVKSTLKVAEEAKMDLSQLQKGVLTIMSKKVVDAALEAGDSKDLARLAGLLLEHGQQQIQGNWFKLASKKFQFKAAEEVLKVLPMAQEFNKEEAEREKARLEAIMLKLFGKDLLDEIIE